MRPAFLRVYEYTPLVFEQFREDVASKPRQLEGLGPASLSMRPRTSLRGRMRDAGAPPRVPDAMQYRRTLFRTLNSGTISSGLARVATIIRIPFAAGAFWNVRRT